MPRWIKQRVVEGEKLNMLMLPDALRRFWDGDKWQSEQLPYWNDQQQLFKATHIADEIRRLIEATRLTL